MSSIKPPQPSAMDAVTCAMAMQAGMAERKTKRRKDRLPTSTLMSAIS